MPDLSVVNPELRFPKVSLVAPSRSAYIYVAAEVDRRPPFLFGSRQKRALIRRCKAWCQEIESATGVREAVVFKALLVPPGRGRFLKQREGKVHIARFDLAILIETQSLGSAEKVKQHPAYRAMLSAIQAAASYRIVVTAINARRINSVDHGREGVFLFNHFFADNTQQNLGVWEYTAGWFQHETGLDNSTVLLPVNREAGYNIINHCRWDKLGDVLPSLIFKESFHSYVLDNFEANHVAAMPILYELA